MGRVIRNMITGVTETYNHINEAKRASRAIQGKTLGDGRLRNATNATDIYRAFAKI